MTDEIDAEACRRMWAASLYEKLRAYFGIINGQATHIPGSDWPNSSDFEQTCLFAGFEPEPIRAWIRRHRVTGTFPSALSLRRNEAKVAAITARRETVASLMQAGQSVGAIARALSVTDTTVRKDAEANARARP